MCLLPYFCQTNYFRVRSKRLKDMITEAQCSELANADENATYLPEGCPQGDDYLGHCLRHFTNNGMSMWNSVYHYALDDENIGPMFNQQSRDSCQSISTDNGDFDVTWCAGSMP